jgi:hypothetical protein
MLRARGAIVVTSSHKRRAEESPVKEENQPENGDRNEWPDDPDLPQGRNNIVPTAQDRGKWDTGGGLRELYPIIPGSAAPLGINGNRPAV